MDSSKIKALLILFFALCFALYLGVAAATAQIETLLWVGSGLFLTICFLLGRHIWILIPATLGMRGSLNIIPGSPDAWQLMTVIVFTFTILRIATRQQQLFFRWTGMETALLLVAFTILQAYFRNPTGLSILGGDVAGGKPYFIFAAAITAYLLISTADADLRSWRWAVIAYIAITLVDGIIAAVAGLSPAFAGFMIRFYSNVSFTVAQGFESAADVDEKRITEFGQIGSLLGMIACSFWRPVAALDFRKPWRGLIALSAVVFTVLGGFRGGSARLFFNFAVASFLRRKPLDVLLIGIIGILTVSIALIAIPTDTLPFSVQRLLTVLPGVQVRSDVARDAEQSNDFRFDMWKLALGSDRYITNKWLGDGFQYSASELAARESMMFHDYRMTGGMTTQEMFMATGAYHGFHVETIRHTGIVGLIAATAALIVIAIFAMRCIRQYRDHAAFGYVIFICMPFLIHPVWYWLIFGDYKFGFPQLIALAGMIRLLSKISSIKPITTAPHNNHSQNTLRSHNNLVT
jgi:hypothetical protein